MKILHHGNELHEIRSSLNQVEKSLATVDREIRDATLKLRALADLGCHADDGERKLAIQYKRFLAERREMARSLKDEFYRLSDLGVEREALKETKKPIERIRLKDPEPIRRKHLTLVWTNPNILQGDYRQ